MPSRPETLSARIRAALDAGAATRVLTDLYYELRGETCHQRPRLLHLLAQATPPAGPPPTPRLMAYQFKAAFADVSAITVQADGSYKEVHAANLTAYDAEYLISDNKGHLLEAVSDEEAAAAAKYATPALSTRTTGLQEPDGSDAQQHDAAERNARAKQQANEAAISDAAEARATQA